MIQPQPQIDDYINALQAHGVRQVTFTLTEKAEPVVVAKQIINNSSGLTSEYTHAHTGRTYGDACAKVFKDVQHVGENQSKILTFGNGN